MQNNNCKIQKVQIPSVQGRAVDATTSIDQSTQQAGKMSFVRATLHHINGETSQIVMSVPYYSGWLEYLEDGANAIREYVNQMTRHWIQITHFFIEIGSIKPDGTFKVILSGLRHDVPLNKVFQSSERGKWVLPEQHPHHPRHNQRGSSRDVADLLQIATERNEAVYLKVDNNKTLCGIPFDSRAFYFVEGDLPSGSFEQDSVTYLVIYSFVKTEKEGGEECAY